MTTVKLKMNFLEAESFALSQAYSQFFGKGNPTGIAFTFIKDRENGKPWNDSEKEIAKYISSDAIKELTRINLTKLIESGVVPDCAMSRRFMATGTGQTSSGYNF